MSPEGSPFNFFDILHLQQTGFSKKNKRTIFTIFGIVKFFNMIIFRHKIWFSLWTSTLYPNFVFETHFFRHYATFFQISFYRSPSTFTRNETFCGYRGLGRVFGTMRKFQKKTRLFQFFCCFQLRKKWFPSLIEHERHSLGVSKLFSAFFIKRPGYILKTLHFLSLKYSADFRRSRLAHSYIPAAKMGLKHKRG